MFYVKDPSDSRLSVVLQGRPSAIRHQKDDPTLDICEMSAFSKRVPSVNEEHEMDDVNENHTDHHEGLWEKIPT